MLLRMGATVKGTHNPKSLVCVWEAQSNTKSLCCTLLEGLHCCKHHHVVGSQAPNLHAAGNIMTGYSTKPLPLPGSCCLAVVWHWQSHLGVVLRLTANVIDRLPG